MTTRRALLGLSLVAALVLTGLTVGQMKKTKLEAVKLTSTAHHIEVNLSPKCTKNKSEVAIPGDTVDWVGKSGETITNFHIIFPVSPFTNQQTYFEKGNPVVTIDTPDESGADFEYVIAVDGGSTCDPHVIVIKGSGTE
jgi:hypothetical protein